MKWRRKQRNALILTYADTISGNPADWEQMSGIPARNIYERLYQGWSVEDIMTIPLRQHRNRPPKEPPSRQLNYQRKMLLEGRCTICGKPAISRSYCADHLLKQRLRSRERHGYQGTNKGRKGIQLKEESE